MSQKCYTPLKIKQYIRDMELTAAYQVGITVLIPVFTAITCGILVSLSLCGCLNQEERRLKKIMIVYLSCSALGWYMAFCYEFNPELFTWLNVLCLLSFVLPSIFFYRIVRFFTRLGKTERFSPLHYLLPGLLAAVMLVWSLFVPIEVQTEIVKGKALVFPKGYEMFAFFFTLKPLLRVIFGMTYYILTIAILVEYYKRIHRKKNVAEHHADWVVFLVGISIASLLSSLLPTFMPRATILYSLWTLLAALAMAFQHILLSFHIIRRKYRLYTAQAYIVPQKKAKRATPQKKGTRATPQKKAVRATPLPSPVSIAEAETVGMPGTVAMPEAEAGPAATPPRRRYHGKLTQERFEAYFRNEKPWLNPSCKITDLIEAFDVNRTTLSSFINRTYGMNLNRYLNHWRVKELNRLRSLPKNKGKSLGTLVKEAGFDNYRTYLRNTSVERETLKKTNKKKGGEK